MQKFVRSLFFGSPSNSKLRRCVTIGFPQRHQHLFMHLAYVREGLVWTCFLSFFRFMNAF